MSFALAERIPECSCSLQEKRPKIFYYGMLRLNLFHYNYFFITQKAYFITQLVYQEWLTVS